MSLILTYELIDNPGREYEVEVTSAKDAEQRVRDIEDVVLWYSLTDPHGGEVAL